MSRREKEEGTGGERRSGKREELREKERKKDISAPELNTINLI